MFFSFRDSLYSCNEFKLNNLYFGATGEFLHKCELILEFHTGNKLTIQLKEGAKDYIENAILNDQKCIRLETFELD